MKELFLVQLPIRVTMVTTNLRSMTLTKQIFYLLLYCFITVTITAINRTIALFISK